jgi:hypothetical protein
MNYNQPEDFEPRETDRQANEPTHHTEMWNSSMLWEVGLILLVALVLVFCAWYFSAQGRDVAEIAGANKDTTCEASVEMVEPSGKIDVDSVPTESAPFDISFGAAKQSGIGIELGSKGPRHSPKSRSSMSRSSVPHSSGLRRFNYPPAVCFWEVLDVTRLIISPDSYRDSNQQTRRRPRIVAPSPLQSTSNRTTEVNRAVSLRGEVSWPLMPGRPGIRPASYASPYLGELSR